MENRLYKVCPCIMAAIGLPVLNSEIYAKGNEPQFPNVIFVLADDLGIGDLGCYGQKLIKTPVIDSLAGKGMLFMNHYAGSTVSAPSRCVLMTGKHTGHSAIRGNKSSVSYEGMRFDTPLPESEITVAEIFHQRGYRTACIGKWGLGGPYTEGHPNNQGFDYFFGYLSQARAHRYYPDILWENQEKVILDNKVYSHDLIIDKAKDFIEDSDGPFFLYLTPTIPHADLDVPDYDVYSDAFEETPFINKLSEVKGYHNQAKPKAAYASMVTRLDSGLGQIMQLLEEKGISDNTLVIFTSDNGVHCEGGNDPDFFDSNSIYRGYKRDLYEGGIHTPFIAYWPNVITPGEKTDHVSTFWDFMPTVCEILDVPVPDNIDGISYLPTLTHQGTQKKHEYLYYEFHERGGKRAIIKGDWKLIELDVYDRGKRRLELYNLKKDPAESQNVLNENVRLAEKLKKIMLKARSRNEIWDF